MATKSVGWRSRDNYQYVLGLDGPLFAWEYLRRNSSYRAHWHARNAAPRPGSHCGWGLPFPD